MASGHTRQQQSRQKELPAEFSSDRSSHSKQQRNGEEELQQKRKEGSIQEHLRNDMEEEKEKEGADEQERDYNLQENGEARNEEQEFFSTQVELQEQNSLLHLHSQTEKRHSTSSGQSTKDQRMPSFSSLPMNADLLPSSDENGTFFIFPSKQVEGAVQSCLSSAESQVTKLLQQAMNSVQSQVLHALHQAAKDIMKHLGNEAAHRIVVAERKAALLDLELASVKQQALSMLLRLKSDIDSQALDADKKYLVERRRAQDAEAKLAIAQDTSKKLRAELKKKGDILEQMQKLVQPMEDHLQKPIGSERLENCSRGVRGDKNRMSPAYSMEGTSYLMCNGTLQCMAVHPSTSTAVRVVDECNRRQSSFSSETPAVEEDSLESRKQTCSSAGIPQDSQCIPGLPEGDMTSTKTVEVREDSLTNDQRDLPGPAEESDAVTILESESEREADQVPDALLSTDYKILDEKIVPTCPDGLRDTEDKEIGSSQGLRAIVKEFYVRRKVRENGKLVEKRGTNLVAEKPGSSTAPDYGCKADSFVTSSSDALAKIKADAQEGELQTSDLHNVLQGLVDIPDSSGLVVDSVQSRRSLVTVCSEKLADTPLEDGKFSGENGKLLELGPASLRDKSAVEVVEFARPDFEVATSLAELAAIGLEARNLHKAALTPNARKEEIFIRPGKTGLRMKRKGISFDKKVSSQTEDKTSKKPRPDKLDIGLTDSQAERVLRRKRADKYSILKESLSLESSRDNRRLMQGARQLLGLAEKKWR